MGLTKLEEELKKKLGFECIGGGFINGDYNDGCRYCEHNKKCGEYKKRDVTYNLTEKEAEIIERLRLGAKNSDELIEDEIKKIEDNSYVVRDFMTPCELNLYLIKKIDDLMYRKSYLDQVEIDIFIDKIQKKSNKELIKILNILRRSFYDSLSPGLCSECSFYDKKTKELEHCSSFEYLQFTREDLGW